jgi:twitching motility two-component system response regulator PilG
VADANHLVSNARIAQPGPVAAGPSLKLLVKGLDAVERRLLDGIVKLSERDTRRRTPLLHLLGDLHAMQADIVIVDARDPSAVVWARNQPWLSAKPAIWIDAASVPSGHTLVRRPVQWPVLPVLLTRAIDQGPRPAAAQPHHNLFGAAPGEKSHANARPPSSTPRILLVDDSSLVRLQLRGELEQRGFEVGEADSAAAALDCLAAQHFDGVLMDVLMPDIDGYEGCRRIKAKFRGNDFMPVVMLTSKSSPFDRIRGKMAGCDAYLTKPVDREQLTDVLARHVRQPKPLFSASAFPGDRPVFAHSTSQR